MILSNHVSVDPFNEPQESGPSQEGFIHIRIQQRNGRKTLTTVQGIADDYDKKKLVKVCKKVRPGCTTLIEAHPSSFLSGTNVHTSLPYPLPSGVCLQRYGGGAP